MSLGTLSVPSYNSPYFNDHLIIDDSFSLLPKIGSDRLVPASLEVTLWTRQAWPSQ